MKSIFYLIRKTEKNLLFDGRNLIATIIACAFLFISMFNVVNSKNLYEYIQKINDITYIRIIITLFPLLFYIAMLNIKVKSDALYNKFFACNVLGSKSIFVYVTYKKVRMALVTSAILFVLVCAALYFNFQMFDFKTFATLLFSVMFSCMLVLLMMSYLYTFKKTWYKVCGFIIISIPFLLEIINCFNFVISNFCSVNIAFMKIFENISIIKVATILITDGNLCYFVPIVLFTFCCFFFILNKFTKRVHIIKGNGFERESSSKKKVLNYSFKRNFSIFNAVFINFWRKSKIAIIVVFIVTLAFFILLGYGFSQCTNSDHRVLPASVGMMISVLIGVFLMSINVSFFFHSSDIFKNGRFALTPYRTVLKFINLSMFFVVDMCLIGLVALSTIAILIDVNIEIYLFLLGVYLSFVFCYSVSPFIVTGYMDVDNENYTALDIAKNFLLYLPLIPGIGCYSAAFFVPSVQFPCIITIIVNIIIGVIQLRIAQKNIARI